MFKDNNIKLENAKTKTSKTLWIYWYKLAMCLSIPKFNNCVYIEKNTKRTFEKNETINARTVTSPSTSLKPCRPARLIAPPSDGGNDWYMRHPQRRRHMSPSNIIKQKQLTDELKSYNTGQKHIANIFVRLVAVFTGSFFKNWQQILKILVLTKNQF